MDATSRYEPNENIVFREEDEGAFLFDPDSGDLRYMNLTGKETFSMLNEASDVGQLTVELHKLYPEIEPEQIKRDLEEFLSVLEQNNFIRPVSSE